MSDLVKSVTYNLTIYYVPATTTKAACVGGDLQAFSHNTTAGAVVGEVLDAPSGIIVPFPDCHVTEWGAFGTNHAPVGPSASYKLAFDPNDPNRIDVTITVKEEVRSATFVRVR